METKWHRALGVATVAGAAHVLHLSATDVLLAVPAAAVFSGGATSPDADNQPWWQALDRWLPDEWLGAGGPLQHRGLMHWLGLPALFWWLVGSHLTGPAHAVAFGAMLGWCSHLAGDCLWGMRGFGHERGIPLLPWGWHVGLGLRADGILEKTFGLAAGAAACWWLAGLGLPLPCQPDSLLTLAPWR